MRQIKFRVMCADDAWHFYTLGDFVVRNPIPERLHANTWGQFTGLTDINGVEIYEGDIVSVDGSGACEVKICSYWGVVYVDSDGYERQHADCVSEQDYPTIIGNIHQNPELLK